MGKTTLVDPNYGMLSTNDEEATMAQERLTLRKIREILRLEEEAGLTNRATARACNISNSTVGEYAGRVEAA
jgi:response regulator of citrate/malate metabolism